MAQPVLIGAEIDLDSIEEFVAEFNEAHSKIENLLTSLEQNSDDTQSLNDLFRHVHTIKGNAHIIGLEEIASYVHVLENILDKLRKKTLQFNRQLGDIVLASLDVVADIGEQMQASKPVDMEMTLSIQSTLYELGNCSEHEYSSIVEKTLAILKKKSHKNVENFHPHLASVCDNKSEDLRFFQTVAINAESRSPLWNNRTARLLHFAALMNRESNYKVKADQLEAAVYLHDFAMSFLPLEILHKGDNLSKEELEKVKLHPQIGSALLVDNNNWLDASEMILHHHEWEDGSGYPKGLKGDQICDGAKILAIADAYEALTNRRAHRSENLSLAHVITEINDCAGSQFSKFWVTIFNSVIRNNKVKKS